MLDKKHYSPNKSDRVMKQKFHPIYKMSTPNKKEFDRVEALLDECSADVINGVPKSDILLKLTDKNNLHYENQKKALTYPIAEEYYRAVMSRLSLDRERDLDTVKDALYGQYLNIYREAMEMGNYLAAKGALDSLVKLYGIDKPMNQTNIQVNSDDIKISFGFENNEE